MAVRFIFLNRAWRLIQTGRFDGGWSGCWYASCANTSGTLRGEAKPIDVGAEKSRLGTKRSTVPQTDTGRQVEDTKVFERTIVKELGNLTP